MKLLYVVNARIPTEKAHGHQIVKMCEEFAKAGAEVELWAPFRSNPIKEDLFDFYGAARIFKFRPIKSFDFLRFDKILGKAALYGQWWFFVFKMFFARVDKNVLIYTRDQGIAWVFGLRGLRVCYEGHGWFAKKTKLILSLLRRASFMVVTNSFIKKEFVKNGFSSDKILVVPNGINLEIFDIKETKEEAVKKIEPLTGLSLSERKILLYTGSFKTMGFEKGIADILRALAKINDKNIVFLAVGGSFSDIKFYQDFAKEQGVTDKAYFYPRQPQQKLAIFQKAADILLLPFPKIAHYEFFMAPLKMFEYMAGKRPIIASDLPSIREILNDRNCFFCRPGDSEDLAKKIKQALDNPVLGEKLAEQACSDARQYSWDKRARKILEFIKANTA